MAQTEQQDLIGEEADEDQKFVYQPPSETLGGSTARTRDSFHRGAARTSYQQRLQPVLNTVVERKQHLDRMATHTQDSDSDEVN